MMSYNPKIKKDPREVVILTLHEKIIGKIYGIPETRMLDALNKRSSDFIPVSNAEVYQKIDDKLLFRTEFICLNIAHIVFVSENTEFP